MSFISILVPCVACVSVPFTELHEHAYTCGTNVYCIPIKYGNLTCYKVYILLLYQVSCMSVFPLVSYINMHIPICCGAKRVLFTNKLSEYCVISLNPTCLSSFMHPSIQVRELHKHACPILMYGPKLFCGFPKGKVLIQNFKYAYTLHVTKLYILPSFIILCGCI